jgi:hypothetical protein
MNSNQFGRLPSHWLVGTACAAALLAASLTGCGGADGTSGTDVHAQAVQSQKEAAALERAQQANRDALGRVKGERWVPPQ